MLKLIDICGVVWFLWTYAKNNYGDIQHTIRTPDKKLNILIHRTPFYVITCRSYKLLKMVQFFVCEPCTAVHNCFHEWNPIEVSFDTWIFDSITPHCCINCWCWHLLIYLSKNRIQCTNVWVIYVWVNPIGDCYTVIRLRACKIRRRTVITYVCDAFLWEITTWTVCVTCTA